MPAAGKSTVGALLATALGRAFVDTDAVLQAHTGRRLQTIIEQDGLDGFCALEERCLLRLNCHNSVIATGGSVVYSEAVMQHLRRDGLIIYLALPLEQIIARLNNLDTRGVAMRPGWTLADVYAKREPLYHRYADVVLDCADRSPASVVAAIQAWHAA